MKRFLWTLELGTATITAQAQLKFNPNQVALLRWYQANQAASFTVGSPASPASMAFDGANLFVTDTDNSVVLKLRASDGQQLGSFFVGPAFGVAFDGAHIWAANLECCLVKLATDGTSLGSFSTGGNAPMGVAFDGANIWVANSNSSNVGKLRASVGTLLGTSPVGTSPQGLAFDGANIWRANSVSNNVTKLRASDGTVLGTFTVGTSPGASLLTAPTSGWRTAAATTLLSSLRGDRSLGRLPLVTPPGSSV